MTQYDLGLALSGGSIKGFAHLGVLQYLDEKGIRPHIIAGTSAGSLMGALYADGYTPTEILECFSEQGLMTMTRFKPFGGGVFDTAKFTDYLRSLLRHKLLEELPIPMRIVATDLDAGGQHVFERGKLAEIITASCCIPVLFNPIVIEGVHYVDGGLFRNFPVSVIRSDCKRIIGVNLGPERGETYDKTLTGVANRAWELVFRQNTRPDKKACDHLLEAPELLEYGMFEVDASREIMAIGYKLAQRELSELSTTPTEEPLAP